jgi:hypothetical protein
MKNKSENKQSQSSKVKLTTNSLLIDLQSNVTITKTLENCNLTIFKFSKLLQNEKLLRKNNQRSNRTNYNMGKKLLAHFLQKNDINKYFLRSFKRENRSSVYVLF